MRATSLTTSLDPRRDGHVLDCSGCEALPRAEIKKWVFETEIRVDLDLVVVTLLEREECVFSMSRQLVVAWGQFLSGFSWDWYVTLTFRDWVKSFRAHRLFEQFMRDLEKAAGIPIFWFRADELGTHGGKFHIHALIGNVAHLRRLTWMDRWHDLAGIARILPFNAKRGAAYYCAKYVTKQSGDWELSDNLRAFHSYQPVLPLEGGTKQRASDASPQPSQQEKGARAAHNRQLPLPPLLNGLCSKRDSGISAVYRSEVTRGRGRFRDFGTRL